MPAVSIVASLPVALLADFIILRGGDAAVRHAATAAVASTTETATTTTINIDTDDVSIEKTQVIQKEETEETVHTLKKVYGQWFKLSELPRFFVSGNIGNLCFYLMEKGINKKLCDASSSLPKFIDEYKDSVSFFVGYLLQIMVQHSLNAFLVYGLHTINTRERYLKTLLGQFSAYSLSLVGSTILNFILLRAGVEKTLAFFLTMAIFACLNFFIIGWLVRAMSSSSSSPSSFVDENNEVTEEIVESSSMEAEHLNVQASPRKFFRGGHTDFGGPSFGTTHRRRLGFGSTATATSSMSNNDCSRPVIIVGDDRPIEVEEVNKCEYVKERNLEFVSR